jgi:rare lipoprotein A (peptidoglycan hydrolase)
MGATLSGLRALSGPRFDAGLRARFQVVFAVALLCALSIGAPAVCRADPTPDTPQVGQASWYGEEFARRKTASGEQFDPQGITGAHRTLPLGSRVRVTNLHNGKSVLVTITDRGPYRRRRAIDLSYGAARLLGMVRRGVAQVRIELVES